MDEKIIWKKRLDATINQLSNQLKIDLYDNTVVEVVRDWFAGSDSISTLNETIRIRLEEAWPISQGKIETAFLEFEASLKTGIHKSHGIGSSAALNLAQAEAEISSSVANVMGSIVAVVSGSIMGGAGIALLVEGPIGWVIGAVLAGGVFFFGKKKVQDVLIEPTLRNRRIPAFIKKPAKSKVASELKLNAPKFEEAIFQKLKEQSAPIYAALENIPKQNQ